MSLILNLKNSIDCLKNQDFSKNSKDFSKNQGCFVENSVFREIGDPMLLEKRPNENPALIKRPINFVLIGIKFKLEIKNWN